MVIKMFKCNYCGRFFKHSFESCPGCGAASFKKIMEMDNMVIEKPPEGGYKINIQNYKTKKLIYLLWIFFITIILFSMVGDLIGDAIEEGFTLIKATLGVLFEFFPFILIGLIIIIFLVSSILNVNKKIKGLEKLKHNGLLIKNLKFDCVQDKTKIFSKEPIYALRVIYKNANGIAIPLTSETKYNKKITKKDKTVDLLIDIDDITNYHIDFEIY